MLPSLGLFVALLTSALFLGVGLLFGWWTLRLRLWLLLGSVFHLVVLAQWIAVQLAASALIVVLLWMTGIGELRGEGLMVVGGWFEWYFGIAVGELACLEVGQMVG